MTVPSRSRCLRWQEYNWNISTKKYSSTINSSPRKWSTKLRERARNNGPRNYAKKARKDLVFFRAFSCLFSWIIISVFSCYLVDDSFVDNGLIKKEDTYCILFVVAGTGFEPATSGL